MEGIIEASLQRAQKNTEVIVLIANKIPTSRAKAREKWGTRVEWGHPIWYKVGSIGVRGYWLPTFIAPARKW
jgi:hypothetical protein